MRNIDRRDWLKTVGLSSGFAFLGGFEALAIDTPKNPFNHNTLARLNANENPYGPSQKVREVLSNNFEVGCRYPLERYHH